MTVKEQVIKLLDENRGDYMSGEALASQIGVSRTAVWKAIKKLMDEGFLIDAVTNRGYKLQENTDVLTKAGIKKYLNPETKVSLEVRKSVTSTNLVMKDYVQEPEGFVLAASEQTGGMGRLGRVFQSPQDTGIYFSLLLKPHIDHRDITLLTVIAAVAVCEAVEKYTDRVPLIKWVNDIFVDGKKVCGILTQASFSMENLDPEYVIVGIGINVYEPEHGFHKDIKNIAGSIQKATERDMKNKLLAEVLNRFFYYYTHFKDRDFVEEYQRRSFVVGKDIYVISGDSRQRARALAVDDDCHLLVEYEDGKKESLSTGEISVRLIDS